jgi:hypothetical protein
MWPRYVSPSTGAESSGHPILDWLSQLRLSTEHLNLLLAALTVLLAVLATAVAIQTLTYMRRRDLELDTRNGWIEIHKAMVKVRVQRSFVMMQWTQMGAYVQGAPNLYEERVKDYTLAAAQLRGQLDRLNDDSLIVELGAFWTPTI